MKIKSIQKTINAKFEDFLKSIEDNRIRDLVADNSIITGGCIASMLLKEQVNDFDIYFRNEAVTCAVASYYVKKFLAQFATAGDEELKVDSTNGRVRIVVKRGYRGATAGDPNAVSETITDSGQIEDTFQETKEALKDDENKPKYQPVFLSTNAITLTGKVQLILRFYGEPDEIHKNYDFVHCTNYWQSWDGHEGKLVLRQAALESILSKELIYIGSKYPLCSIIRLRKFIARQWTVNAGQILKMIMQCGELDLKDPAVLEDQLTGVDSAYFAMLIEAVNKADPAKINCAYLCEIIDRIF